MIATKFDPQLHIARSIVNSISDRRQRNEAASARLKLYQAVAAGDREAALAWLDALEISLVNVREAALDSNSQKALQRALEAIRKGLEEPEAAAK